MRATNLSAQIASSLALLSFLTGTCAQQDAHQEALGGHSSRMEQEARDRDLMHNPGLKNAEIDSLLPSDEMPRSTSAKTTCEPL